MPFIPEGELEKVRASADIVQIIGERIPLKRAGRHLRALCPFHAEKTPSFMVNPERQIYHCFGCGEGGNVFSFLMKMEGLEFPEAVQRVAERFGVTLNFRREDPGVLSAKRSEKEILFRINQLAARHFFENLSSSEQGKKGRAYLDGRKIRTEMMREFPLGYATPGGRDLLAFLQEKQVPLDQAERLGLIRRRNYNQSRRDVEGEAPSGLAGGGGDASPYYDFFRDRLLFAIVSPEGKVIGFSGRALGEGQDPKYLNSPDSPIYSKGESLLGFSLARQSIRERDQVVVVEGNFDQLRLYQEGITQTVAPLGTALTERQIRLLSRFTSNFVLLFDGDAAGQKAAVSALQNFLPLGLFPRAVTLPPQEDPDSFVMKSGAAPLQQRIDSAPPLLDLLLEKISAEEGASTAGKGRLVKRLVEFLELIQGNVEKSLYIQKVAQMAGVPDQVIEREVLKKVKKGSNFLPPKREDIPRVPTVEKAVVEILISGKVPPAELFKTVRAEDFSHISLGELWSELQRDFEEHQSLDVSRLVNEERAESVRGLLTELAVGAARWQEEEDQVVLGCVKRLRLDRYRVILKGISRELRQAEVEQDFIRVEELQTKENSILKEMSTIH